MTAQHGKNKTGAVRDEVLKKQAEAELRAGRSLRMEEERDIEPAAEARRPAEAGTGTVPVAGTPPGMTERDVVVRTELAQHLGRSIYPADRNTILRTLHDTHAPDELITLAGRLPAGERYGNVQGIAIALGLGVEDHRP